jgi:hypothetical protein
MSWIAANPEVYLGTVVGDGHCVAFVRHAAGAPQTALWRRGGWVHDLPQDALPKGLAIATFDPDGRYGNHTDGRSHAAILLARQGDGLLVLDQWKGQPVHQRLIRFRAGQGDPVNDGDRYALAEPAAAGTTETA